MPNSATLAAWLAMTNRPACSPARITESWSGAFYSKTMNYWPGTNIPRSRGNAFDWRNYKTGFDVAAFRKQASRHQRQKPHSGLSAGRFTAWAD